MAIYKFRCSACDTEEEVRTGYDKPAYCSICKERMKKVFYPTAIVFRGQGFYKTDNASKVDLPETS